MYAVKVGADELAVPWPIVFGIAGGMNADIATTPLDVAFKGGLLIVVEYFAGGKEEDDGVVLFEVGVSEGGGIFGEVDGNVMCGGKFL